MGRPVDLLFVETLVREFDVETSEKNFLRRKLRFLTVSEFLPIAGDALTRAFTGTGDGGSSGGSAAGGSQAGGGSSRTAQTNSRQSGSSSSSSRSNSSSGANFGGGSSGGFGGGGGGGGGSSLGDSEVSSAPESVLVGRTLLVADNITNSIVVQGPPSGLEIIERLLDQIDVKPDQVMISTVIGQYTLNDSKEFGVNYLFDDKDISLGGGGSGGAILPLAATATSRFPQFDPASLSGSGLRALGTVGDLGIYLKALQSKTDFTVLSRPSIFTSNNQKGTISSGERIAIPTSNNNFSGGGSSTNIEYQDVVLKLEVIPLVNSDNEITMKIALLNDEQNGNQVIEGGGSDGGDLTVPRISTREILTTATIPNGQTIVLGGLIVGKNNQEKSGIPLLGDIPYLGKLFSTTGNNEDRSELMVLIQPSIVSNSLALDNVQSDMDSRYQSSDRVRGFADGPGVLPPVDAIAPTNDKQAAPSAAAPAAKPAVNSAKKPSIRPLHRR
jgi:type II secretion system protein D